MLSIEMDTVQSINTTSSLLFRFRCLFKQVTSYREKTLLSFTDNCVPLLVLAHVCKHKFHQKSLQLLKLTDPAMISCRCHQ